MLNDKSYAICLCGGGLRTTISSISLIENFNKKYSLKNIKYLSGTSGSTISIILNHYDTLIINDYNEPNECTLEILDNKKKDTFVDKFSNLVVIDDVIKAKFSKNNFSFWINFIKDIFFKDVNFDNNKNKNDKPEYILTCSIFFQELNENYYQLEFLNKTCSLPNKIIDKNNIYLYGGYETNLNNFIKDLEINRVIQCALSSNFIDSTLEYKSGGKIKTFEWELLNPITNSINISSIVDGGIYDNLGIISCLRRKMKNIHINIFTDKSIIDKDFLNNDLDSGYFKFFEGNDNDNKFTIFKRETWLNLYKELSEKFLSGKSTIVNLKTEIIANEYLDIEPYGEINFLFHINSCNKEWFSELPKCTQKYILNEYNDFPYFNFLKYKYNPITINLIYNLIGWEVRNSKEYELFYSEL